MKKLILACAIFFGCLVPISFANDQNAGSDVSDFRNTFRQPYCQGEFCSLESGVRAAGRDLQWVSREKASDYLQGTVGYFLGFISIIAVLLIIYAGIQILLSAWDDEKVTKGKNIIIYTILGITVIWLANAIVMWVFNVLGAAA